MQYKKKSNKYKAQQTNVDDYTFDSLREADRYNDLKLLQRSGEIRGLTLQPRFVLQEKFKHSGKTIREISYIADFSYQDIKTGDLIIEDVKGVETPVFKLKHKLFLYRYPLVKLIITK